ncbi:MAG: hypothetical protein LPJ98_07555 [Cyclobacteriaceae bacterium]|nr:hypothetical protein [Cyclobacteriaceae bacterium]
MKKTILSLSLTAIMMAAGTNLSVAASKSAHEERNFTEAEILRFKEIESRVLEIKEMNFSEMSKEERKEIRSELKELNKEAKANRGSGLYISTGALIVILILLIILL